MPKKIMILKPPDVKYSADLFKTFNDGMMKQVRMVAEYCRLAEAVQHFSFSACVTISDGYSQGTAPQAGWKPAPYIMTRAKVKALLTMIIKIPPKVIVTAMMYVINLNRDGSQSTVIASVEHGSTNSCKMDRIKQAAPKISPVTKKLSAVLARSKITESNQSTKTITFTNIGNEEQ